jgi:hypothetical protein
MDNAARTTALKTAKALIKTHGLMGHMNKYNQDQLAREVYEADAGFRCDFHLDPKASAWADQNPSCSIILSYTVDPKGTRLADDRSTVLDHHLSVRISANGNDMTMETFRKREALMSMTNMLCEMLIASLPRKVTSMMETAAETADRVQRAMEQTVGHQIFLALGTAAFKGLRKNGTARSFRLPTTAASTDGKYPDTGTYRYRQVRSTDSLGRPREVAHYSIRVYGSDGTVPPSLSIRRVDAVQSQL